MSEKINEALDSFDLALQIDQYNPIVYANKDFYIYRQTILKRLNLIYKKPSTY